MVSTTCAEAPVLSVQSQSRRFSARLCPPSPRTIDSAQNNNQIKSNIDNNAEISQNLLRAKSVVSTALEMII